MIAQLIREKIKISDITKGVVASRPKQMYAWPGITRAANGDIIVAASERKFHVCPYGRQVIMRSKDNGASWSLPQEVYNSELDDRDSNLVTLKDGTLVLSWFTSNAFEMYPLKYKDFKDFKGRTARVSEQMRRELLGPWMLKSRDNGENWDPAPLRMPVGMHVSPTQLSDGSLFSIGWTNMFENEAEKLLCGYHSYDAGESWSKSVTFDCPQKDGKPILNENHVLEVAPGKLIAMFRKCGDFLYQAFSDDYGKTWTTPQQTKIWGYPPHLLKLSDGRILCVFSHRRTPYSIRGVLSADNGKTWDIDNIFTLYEWTDELDMGYPVSQEVAPGEILTVFYCSRRDEATPNTPEPWKTSSAQEGILSIRYRIR